MTMFKLMSQTSDISMDITDLFSLLQKVFPNPR